MVMQSASVMHDWSYVDGSMSTQADVEPELPPEEPPELLVVAPELPPEEAPELPPDVVPEDVELVPPVVDPVELPPEDAPLDPPLEDPPELPEVEPDDAPDDPPPPTSAVLPPQAANERPTAAATRIARCIEAVMWVPFSATVHGACHAAIIRSRGLERRGLCRVVPRPGSRVVLTPRQGCPDVREAPHTR
jgi:hypothetical protein